MDQNDCNEGERPPSTGYIQIEKTWYLRHEPFKEKLLFESLMQNIGESYYIPCIYFPLKHICCAQIFPACCLPESHLSLLSRSPDVGLSAYSRLRAFENYIIT